MPRTRATTPNTISTAPETNPPISHSLLPLIAPPPGELCTTFRALTALSLAKHALLRTRLGHRRRRRSSPREITEAAGCGAKPKPKVPPLRGPVVRSRRLGLRPTEHGAVFVSYGVRSVWPNRTAETVQRQRSARPLPAQPRSPPERHARGRRVQRGQGTRRPPLGRLVPQRRRIRLRLDSRSQLDGDEA